MPERMRKMKTYAVRVVPVAYGEGLEYDVQLVRDWYEVPDNSPDGSQWLTTRALTKRGAVANLLSELHKRWKVENSAKFSKMHEDSRTRMFRLLAT